MIPHGLMTMLTENGEIRILEMSALGFTFRLPIGETAEFKRIRVLFYSLPDEGHCFVDIQDHMISEESRTRFYTEYRLETQNREYAKKAKAFMRMFARYVEIRSENRFEAMTPGRIPGEAYCMNLKDQRMEWADRYVFPFETKAVKELAIGLSDPELIGKYLAQPIDAFIHSYFEERFMAGHPAAGSRYTCLYIGNRFCPILFPDIDTIRAVMQKANKESLHTVLCIPPMPESMIDSTTDVLRELIKTDTKIEVEVNDWGMLEILRLPEFIAIEKTLGVLLCKYRKDPRAKYLPGKKDMPEETSIDAEFFREWIEGRFGPVKYACESGKRVKTDAGNTVMYWPVMQLNTSGNCTLRAACENGDRRIQCHDIRCEKYCLKNVFIYPKHMNVLGKYNSLFGIAEEQCTIQAFRIVVDVP